MVVLWVFSLHHQSANTAPIIIITMMIAMPTYSTVDSLANPVAAVGVGASVACAAVATKLVSADDGQ